MTAIGRLEKKWDRWDTVLVVVAVVFVGVASFVGNGLAAIGCISDEAQSICNPSTKMAVLSYLSAAVFPIFTGLMVVVGIKRSAYGLSALFAAMMIPIAATANFLIWVNIR
jgi:hypothetical protein